MKHTTLSILLVLAVFSLKGQQNATLKVESYQLENGFTVFLNPDPTATRVFGMVTVSAGAKNENPDATGMAHYLEHLLFKGTTELGTYDYQKEKPHLDSISILYEQLAKATTDESRLSIQKQINQQALKASKYGLPNEFDKLLKSIGSTGINATTSYDRTTYYNSFPAHEMEKWLDIYSTRFRNPVFRSFQSELEVVYEEKNRSMDNFERRIGEQVFKHLFPKSPYGQWTVLGITDHLKNPSLLKMYEFFEKYYVSENMALVLTGNFESDKVKPVIARTFKDFRTGSVSKEALPVIRPFDGIEKFNARMTPARVGFTGYQTVSATHPDRAVLDVYEYLLSNNSNTGLFNQLMQNNEMMYSGTIPLQYDDAGGFVFYYVPKILVQSLGAAEKKCLDIIENINSGQFDEQLFQIAKNEIQMTFKRRLANPISRGKMIGVAFNQGRSWEEYLSYSDKVANVSKEDLMRVGKQYFGPDRMKFISRTGLSKKNKLKKPPYKPIVTDQKESSAYSKKFNEIPSLPFSPKYVDLKKGVDRTTIKSGHEIYAEENSVNDLFDLTIRFKKGALADPLVSVIPGITRYAGAGSDSRIAFKKKFAIEGLNYRLWYDGNYLAFNLSGKHESIDKGLMLLNQLMTDPKIYENSKKAYLNALNSDRKLEKRNPDIMGNALLSYAVYGERSAAKTRKSVKDMKKMDFQNALKLMQEIASNYGTETTYYGQLSARQVAEKINEYLNLSDNPQQEVYRIKEADAVSKTKIYLVKDKKTVQNQIYFYLPGEVFDREDFAVNKAFNQYFSGGFSGLVLQEIREYRSLAYSAGANYTEPDLSNQRSLFYAKIACQSDKSIEAIEVMKGLIDDMPAREERMETLKSSLQLKVVSQYPQPGSIANTIRSLERKGYAEDPNIKAFNEYKRITMDDIVAYYEKSLKGKAMAITVYGDLKNIDMDKVRSLGEVIELKKSDIVSF
ncbi:MAG: insulinase family protein [Bacteroidota bacterium]